MPYKDSHRKEYFKQYRDEHKEESQQYRDEHKKEKREYDRQYAKDNRPSIVARNRKYRALKLSQLGLWDTDAFIERQLFLYQNGKCYYCGTTIKLLDHSTFHMDHCTPLAREGKHGVSNVALACPPCNFRKGVKTEKEFKEKQ